MNVLLLYPQMVEAQPKTKSMKLPLSENQFIFQSSSTSSRVFYGKELSKVSTLSAFKSSKESQITKYCNLLGKFNLEGIPRGVPLIEVTFDIEAIVNINVNVQYKGTGQSSNVTIANDKGRISKNDIKGMVAETERFKHQDEAFRRKFEAKHSVESYAYNLKNNLNDEKIRDEVTLKTEALLKERLRRSGLKVIMKQRLSITKISRRNRRV